MAKGTKIRGITIELDGDTTGLTKALKEVNGEIKDTQTALKDVERLLKLDPKNVDLLKQKQQLLNKAIEDSNKKLKTLKQAEAQMKSNGVDENSEQFMALQREIIATEQQLEKLKETAGETSNAFDKIGEVAGKVATKADDLAKKTRGLSAAGAAVAGAIGALGLNSIKAADELATLSSRTGISTDTLQKFAYASDMVDVSTEELASALAKMKKNMAEHPEAFENLGIAVKDTEGNFRDIEDVFYDSLAALSGITNETERDIVAMDLFGKSADSLATIIDDGGQSLKDYGDKAEELGVILDEDTITKLTETGDKIDEVKARATSTMAVVGAELIEKLEPTILKITDTLASLLEKLASLDGETLNTIFSVGLVVAAISPVAGIISGIAKAIEGVSGAISFLVANPIVALIAAVVGVVALIAVKGDEIQEKLQEVDDYLKDVFEKDWTEEWGKIGEVVNGAMKVINGAWDGFKQTEDGIIDFIRGIFTGDWERAWHGIEEIMTNKITAMESTLEGLSGWIKNKFSIDWSEKLGGLGEPINALVKNVQTKIDNLKEIMSGIKTWIKGAFTLDWNTAWEGMKKTATAAWQGISSVAKGPINIMIGLMNSLIDAINIVIRGLNKINFTVPDWVPGVGGKSWGINISQIGKIPLLAQGGILESGSAIVGEAGPELLSMMGNRAVVQPLTNNTTNQNYGGVTLNIYGAAGQNVQELAEIIMDEIGNATRRQEAAFA